MICEPLDFLFTFLGQYNTLPDLYMSLILQEYLLGLPLLHKLITIILIYIYIILLNIFDLG